MNLEQRAWLKHLRLKQRYSQRSLAEIIGVSRNTVYLWERGEITPTREARRHLAQLLGLGFVDAWLDEERAFLTA